LKAIDLSWFACYGLVAAGCGGRTLSNDTCENAEGCNSVSIEAGALPVDGDASSSDPLASADAGGSNLDSASPSGGRLDSGSSADAPAGPHPDAGVDTLYPLGECEGFEDILVLDGDPGDKVHPGKETWFENEQTGTWSSLSSPNDVGVDIGLSVPIWRAQFARADAPVVPGLYLDAGSSVGLEAGAGLYVGQLGPDACSSTSGSFYIQDVEWRSDGSDITSLTASFEQHCDGATAFLRGCIHYVGD
jgi:hypothetical protein